MFEPKTFTSKREKVVSGKKIVITERVTTLRRLSATEQVAAEMKIRSMAQPENIHSNRRKFSMGASRWNRRQKGMSGKPVVITGQGVRDLPPGRFQ